MGDAPMEVPIDPELVSKMLQAKAGRQTLYAMWDSYVEEMQLWAKSVKARFDALVEQGFDPAKALELVKTYIEKTGGL